MDKNLSLLYEIKEIKSLLKVIEKRLENIEDEVLDRSRVLTEGHDCDDLSDKDKKLNADNVWNNAKDIIKDELTEVSFNTWIEPIIQFKIEENTIFLQVCNEFSKSILEARYIDLLTNAIYQVMDSSFNLELLVEEDLKEEIK